MTDDELLARYNVPAPRYTSYPPANCFTGDFTPADYAAALEASDSALPAHLSFYIHIPFCRQLCHYCGCNAFLQAGPEQIERYVSALHREISYMAGRLNPRRRIAQIHYGGGTPSILPAGILKELNEHLLASFPVIERPEVAIECHPGYLDENGWQSLAEAGFNRFSIGVQDFDERVLKAVNRRPSRLPPESILAILREACAGVNLDFIYGLPLQTAESFTDTILRAVALQPDRMVTFSYAHLPSVNRRQLVLERKGLPAGEEKSRMFSGASETLRKAGYRAVGLDHFVRETDELYAALLSGQLHRNFQGYCTRRTTGQVYAFGATAISQLAGAYAQNSRDVEDYIARIDAGWATVRGYRLNEDERIAREVIESLMCNFFLSWTELSSRLALPVERIRRATAYDPAVLRRFADDGVITFDDDQIRITPRGTPFVRNVAASLDRLMTTRPGRIFSKTV
jgi:oxygen-independent coproporphyrinogen-3 oxidase